MKMLNCIGVALLFCCFSAFAQPSTAPGATITISGKISNAEGEVLANANVTTQNGRGTMTNVQGKFTLKNVNPADVLHITFIGYQKREIPVNNQSSINIILTRANNELDRVIVQAYGQSSQRLATGNIAKISSEEINRQPLMNPIQTIQGLAAGVVVTNTSGFASSAVKIEVRGRKTIDPAVPSDPLYIVDGVPLTVLPVNSNNATNYQNGSQGFIQSGIVSPANGQSPFFSINPNDIESIEVLKDADATAIYGSRAANGVILITTKKGRTGKTKFDLSVRSGISQVTSNYELLNTQQYIEMRKEALSNDNRPINQTTAPDIVSWDTTRLTDWQDYIWGKTGKSTNVDASLSGGDSRTSFRIGAGYHTLTEVTTATGMNKRATLSLSLNHKTNNNKFTTSLSAQYSNTSNNLRNLVASFLVLPPNAPAVYNASGNLNYAGWQPLTSLFQFGSLINPYVAETNFLNTNLKFDYEPVKGLHLSANFGYNNAVNTQKNLTTIASQNPQYNPTGRAEFGNTLFRNVLVEPLLEYATFIGKSRLSFLTGSSFQTNNTTSNYNYGAGYGNDALINSISNAATKLSYSYSGQYKYIAYFGRINYNLDDKYLVNLNFRRDGSSKFGPGRQFGNFGSAGLAWTLSKEKWFKIKPGFISFAKLRASYGITGGDQITDYSFLTSWQFMSNPYNGSQLLNPIKHTDSLLHWQKNIKREMALETGFMKDRILLNISWYQENINDQLVGFPTPAFTGFPNVTSNSPAEVQNSGWEFVLNTQNLIKNSFRWSSKFIFALNRNKLLSYPNLEQSPYAGIFVVGQPLNVQKVLHWTGVDPQTGYYTFEDKNKNDVVDFLYDGSPDDSYFIDLTPKFEGSLTNNLKLKQWEINFLFYFKKQTGRNALIGSSAPGTNYNQSTEVLNRWQKPGDITTVAKFTTNPYSHASYTHFSQRSDGIYTDASFIRLQNISVSYSFSSQKLQKVKISSLSLYLNAQNVFTITNYKGIDPEVQNFGGLPRPRIVTAGLTIGI